MNPLVRMILVRLANGVMTLVAISLIIFFAIELLPGDVAEEILGQDATEETIEALRRELGLDRPAFERYLSWLFGAVQGEFGTSLASNREISELIGVRLGNSVFLAVLSASISIPVALALGILTALYRNSVFDRVVNILTLMAVSLPSFFAAYVFILLFSVQLGLFPSIANVGTDDAFWTRIEKAFLPALTLTIVVIAYTMRMTRAAITSLLNNAYIEMAHLKGIRKARIIVVHALPNALSPIINVIAINLAYLVVGVVIVEVIFAYQGLGQLLVDAVGVRDVPVVQTTCLIFATVYLALNLLADIFSILSNPRLLHPK